MEIEDRQLVKRVLGQDLASFRVLVDRHQQAVYRYAYGLLGSREEAQDVTQEAFLAAYTNLSRFDASRGSFLTWLFTITRNRCINYLKKNRPKLHPEPEKIQSPEPIDSLAQRELSQQLDHALAALPMQHRSAFVLAEIEKLSYAEIARIEQTTLGTVKSRIHRAKQRLQSILQPVIGD